MKTDLAESSPTGVYRGTMILPSILQITRDAVSPRAGVDTIRWIAVVCGLTAVYAVVAVVTPPADDEYYYWCWAQTLQWSYYDHPAMSAIFIRASGELFGHNLLALRFSACLSTAIVFAIILYLTQPREPALWLLATPVFTLGAVIITPDTPLLVFWALYALWLGKLHERLESQTIPWSWWLTGGAILGCGVLGKYTMALAVPAGAMSFLAIPWRRWLTGYVLHGMTAFIVALPILIYNLQREFAPLLYQWNHSMASSGAGWRSFGDFLGIQVVLFGTLPVVLFPWVIWNLRSLCVTPRLRVAVCLYGFPFAFFMFKAMRGHLEGNWALASYIGFWPLAAEWLERHRRRRIAIWCLRLSFLPAVLAVAAVSVHLVAPWWFIKPDADRLTRQTEKDKLAAAIAAEWRRHPLPLYAETYQWVALLRFHGIDARQIDGVSRASHFTQTPQHITDVPEAYVLWENVLGSHLKAGLTEPRLAAEYPLVVRGRTATTFYLWRVERRPE